MQTVKDIMTPEIKAIPDTATVAEAAAGMKDNDIGFLPIASSEGEVVGVLTDRDIVLRSVAEGQDPNRSPARGIASRKAVCCHAGDTLDQAANIMASKAVRRLLVLDEQEHPVGTVSLGDLARRVSENGLAGKVLTAICDSD